MKIDEGKPKLSLIYKSFVDETAKVRMYGLTKYPDQENWRTTKTEEHYDALLRHVFAAKAHFLSESSGEENDVSSDLDHLSHAACNIMFLIEEKYTGKKKEKEVIKEAIVIKETEEGEKK